MNQLNCKSMTRVYLPSIPSTERENGKKHFRWSWQCLPCLSFLIVPHRTRSAAIGSYSYESALASPSLTSIIVSTLRSHKHWTIKSPRVYFSLSLPWSIYCSYMVWPWWIRGSAHTHAEVKARRDIYRSLSRISLWRVMTRSPVL